MVSLGINVKKKVDKKPDLSKVPSSLGGTQKNNIPFLPKKTISGGGGGSGQSTPASVFQEQVQRQMAEQQARQQREQQAREQAEAQAQAEKVRIENLRRAIVTQGAREQARILMNQQGQRIQQVVTNIKKIENGRPTDITVVKRTNLATGETTLSSSERTRAGQRATKGGVSFSQYVEGQQEVPIKISEKPNNKGRIEVTLNSGRVVDISPKGNVTVQVKGSSKPLYFYDGQWVERRVEDDGRDLQQVLKDRKIKKLTGVDLVEVRDIERKTEDLKKKIRNMEAPKTSKEAFGFQKDLAALIIGTAISGVYNFGVGSRELIKQIKKDPYKTIISLPPAIYQGVKQDLRRVIKGDILDVIQVATEYYTLGKISKYGGKAFKGAFRLASKVSPKYVKLVGNTITLRKPPVQSFKVRGKTKLLKTRVQKPSIVRPFSSVADFLKGRKAGQFKKFTKDPGLVLKSQTVKSGSTPLSKQALLAGKEVTAVNASANQLTSWLKRKSIIRKPIPGEANFPSRIKNLLNKFDNGIKLSNKEFADVNKWLQKNVAPNITLLERSLYLDPASGLRVSRLGIQASRTASIRDILKGNFKLFDRQKPQVLVFENAKIAKFPKALRGIERKLKAGKTLTTAETNRLIRWQVQTGSGRFKPIGSTIYAGGRELEITLAPGELIRRVKKIGFTYIDGKKVTFVSAEIFKPSRLIIKQMKLAELGKLSKSAVDKLNKFLSKKLGRKVRVETPELAKSFTKKASRIVRRADPNIPVLRVRGSGIVVLRSGLRGLVARPSAKKPLRFNRKVTGRIVKRGIITRKKTTRPTNRVVRRGGVVRKPIKRTPVRRSVTKRVTRPVRPIRRIGRNGKTGRTPKKPVLRIPEEFRSKKLQKQVPTYYVVEKVRGKFKKLFPKPLTQKDARDYAAYSIDNRLSKTAFFIPLGKAKNVVRPPKQMQGYFSDNSRKFRPYKIRFGKKRELVNGFIEKRKFSFDKPGERRTAKVLRVSSKRVQPKRKISSIQRRELLMRLKRARAVRMRNLKKRR